MSIKHSDWLVILETLDLPVCCQPNFTLLSKRFRWGLLQDHCSQSSGDPSLETHTEKSLSSINDMSLLWKHLGALKLYIPLPLDKRVKQCHFDKCFSNLKIAFLKRTIVLHSRVCEEALGSIFSQENQRRLIHSNRRLQDTYPLLQQRQVPVMNDASSQACHGHHYTKQSACLLFAWQDQCITMVSQKILFVKRYLIPYHAC